MKAAVRLIYIPNALELFTLALHINEVRYSTSQEAHLECIFKESIYSFNLYFVNNVHRHTYTCVHIGIQSKCKESNMNTLSHADLLVNQTSPFHRFCVLQFCNITYYENISYQL